MRPARPADLALPLTWMSSSHQHQWCWSLAWSLQWARRLLYQDMGHVPRRYRNVSAASSWSRIRLQSCPIPCSLSQYPPSPPAPAFCPCMPKHFSTDPQGKPVHSSPLRSCAAIIHQEAGVCQAQEASSCLPRELSCQGRLATELRTRLPAHSSP